MNFPNLQSHKTQLALTALLACAGTVAALSTYSTISRRRRRKELDEEIRRSITPQDSSPKSLSLKGDHKPPSALEYDDSLVREQLARNYAIFGDEGMERIRGGSVVVVGCGGVGSWAAVMLVRSGISKIRLIDFDYVTLSSLNRHATALLQDVGTPKVYCVERTLRQISKVIEVDARVELWNKDQAEALLSGYDWVFDAIDNITTKVDLIHYCHSNGLKIFSSMGAGAKIDPTRIQIADISNTLYDPLAKAVRYRLRKLGVSTGVPVVFSTEVPEKKLLPLPEEEFEKGKIFELSAIDDFRVRILPVFGTIPCIFGLHAASYMICSMAGQPIKNPLPIKNRRGVYEKMLKELHSREQKLTGAMISKLAIDEDDVSFIFEDLHRGRSVVPPHAIPTKPALVRWDPSEPLTVENCVVMDSGEVQKHIKGCADGKQPAELWGNETAKVVRKRQADVAFWRETVM